MQKCNYCWPWINHELFYKKAEKIIKYFIIVIYCRFPITLNNNKDNNDNNNNNSSKNASCYQGFFVIMCE